MSVYAKLTVCRRLDNRQEGEDDRSLSALELHRLRAKAMHDVLDDDPAFSFDNWEQPDDEEPHEWVEIIGWIGEFGTELSEVAVPALNYIGNALLQAGIGSAGVAGIVKLFKRFRKKQVDGECRDVELHVPYKTEVSLHPDQGTITISMGTPVSLPYDASESEINKLGTGSSELIEVPSDLVPFVRSLIKKHEAE